MCISRLYLIYNLFNQNHIFVTYHFITIFNSQEVGLGSTS